MSDEEANQHSDANEQREETGKEQKRTPRKRSAKKVVSRIRDAKSDSADRKPKEAPVEETSPEGDQSSKEGSNPEEKGKEIKTVVEKAPDKDGRPPKDDRRKSGRGRRGGKSGGSPRGGGGTEPVDPGELAKRAWKIFQSDVAEEGIALVDNNTGRQLAQRSFELAQVFLEEQSRQMRQHGSSKEQADGGKRDPKDEGGDDSPPSDA